MSKINPLAIKCCSKNHIFVQKHFWSQQCEITLYTCLQFAMEGIRLKMYALDVCHVYPAFETSVSCVVLRAGWLDACWRSRGVAENCKDSWRHKQDTRHRHAPSGLPDSSSCLETPGGGKEGGGRGIICCVTKKESTLHLRSTTLCTAWYDQGNTTYVL